MQPIRLSLSSCCAFIAHQLHTLPYRIYDNKKGQVSSIIMDAHPVSQYITDTDGKWRLCAGVAVFNSKNEILIGERIGIEPSTWQTAQGGVDVGETILEASKRELYEELGLKFGRHVMMGTNSDDNTATISCKYKTEGTGSWLEKQGFAGQQLTWSIFRCCNSDLELNPELVCNLQGLGGEKPEFSAVQWKSLDWVVNNVWEKKREPYKVLQEASMPLLKEWNEKCISQEFSGKWSRDFTRNVNVEESLLARGLSQENATRQATKAYLQQWKQDKEKPREWIVTTEKGTGKPSRELRYPMGEFTESYEGESTIFGSSIGGSVKRCCFYLDDENSDSGVAHVTVSYTAKGTEESLRYLKNDELILKRSYLPLSSTDKIISTEVFIRC